MKRFRICFGVAASVALILAGCGGGDDLGLVPVSGTVTHKGQPLEGAQVTFIPDESTQQARPGGDTTGPSGNYYALTNGRTGLVPGKYKVVVSKLPVSPGSQSADDPDNDPHMMELSLQSAAPKRKGGGGPALQKIEQEFQREIPPDGGTQDFDLE